MKFSEQWLREWVNPSVSTGELCHQLTMAGLEVDAVEPVAAAFSGVVVAEVLSVAPHPDADKLRVTQVNVGEAEPVQIVCGAANVRAGLRVACAVVGAQLPGDFKIKKAKLRGVPSNGMLCSASELGLAESSSGLLELPADAPVGDNFRDYLQLDDVTIELGLTPNRGDCLSIAGIAREAGVLNHAEVQGPACTAVAATIADILPITVSAQAACPRYLGRVIRGVNVAATTPLWMQERLRRSGTRSLGPVVDVTNYVLLELGQPMHAFDLDKLSGGIQVRLATASEKLRLLNEEEVTLDSETLVIADDNGALAMAGVMGGAASAVSDTTRDIFLEGAFFTPASIAGRARRYGLHTDSSHRFERGVSPELATQAMERATALLLAIAGGSAGAVSEVCAPQFLPQVQPITLRHARIERVLGTRVAAESIDAILRRLDMQVEAKGEGWQVIPPAFRFDISIEEDLIEEIGRIIGYSNLPSTRPQAALRMGECPEAQLGKGDLAAALVARGYQEAITYTFVEPKMQQLLDPQRSPIALANPISADMSVMRTTLWAGLLPVLQHNLNRQQGRVRLFEYGLRFIPLEGGAIQQDNVLAGLLFGPVLPEQWGASEQKLDFFDLKGDVEALLALGGRPDAFTFSAEPHPALHPGQSARIYLDGKAVGWLGAAHPSLESQLGLSGHAFLFEIEAAALLSGTVAKFSEISKYPAIRRDIALVLERHTPASAVVEAARRAAPDTLQNLKLFDVYQGEHIDSGRKSIALGLTLQAQSRTLTDEEVDSAIEQIVTTLANELGAVLRE
ncbi:MAG: phenylalanine--tRNA ligase subunit beta [Gammaproteobacteria bacterium]|nr:phenylalanine--tRNA ligase subunit beta [Gammaproteobacteria bacterium]